QPRPPWAGQSISRRVGLASPLSHAAFPRRTRLNRLVTVIGARWHRPSRGPGPRWGGDGRRPLPTRTITVTSMTVAPDRRRPPDARAEAARSPGPHSLPRRGESCERPRATALHGSDKFSGGEQ